MEIILRPQIGKLRPQKMKSGLGILENYLHLSFISLVLNFSTLYRNR